MSLKGIPLFRPEFVNSLLSTSTNAHPNNTNYSPQEAESLILRLLDAFLKPPAINLPENFHIYTLNFPIVLSVYVVLTIGLWLPPFRFREYIVVTLSSTFIYTLIRSEAPPDLVFTPIWSFLGFLKTLDLFVLNGPVPEDNPIFREKSKVDKNPRDFGPWEKLVWSLSLALGQRGINWGWEVKNVRHYEKQPSRISYCLTRLKWIAISQIVMDLASSLHSVFQYQDDLSRFGRIFIGSLIGVAGGFAVQKIYSIIALIAVGSGLGAIESWPPLYHHLSECYSMRRFWGKVYHQIMRRPFTQSAERFLDVLGISRRSFIGRLVIRIGGFTLSGIGHMMNAMSLHKTDLGVFYIFMYYLFVTTLEDILSPLYDRAVGRHGANRNMPRTRLEKTFGYVWTYATLTLSWWMLTEGMAPTDQWLMAPTDNWMQGLWISVLKGTKYLKEEFR